MQIIPSIQKIINEKKRTASKNCSLPYLVYYFLHQLFIIVKNAVIVFIFFIIQTDWSDF